MKWQPTPGAHRRIPIDAYHAAEGWSSSQLRDLLDTSPRDFWHKHVDPERRQPDLTRFGETNRAIVIGGLVAAIMESSAHALLGLYKDHGYYVMAEDASKKNKNSTEFREAFKTAQAHGTAVLWSEYQQALAIVDATKNHPDPVIQAQLSEFLNRPDLEAELSFVCEDKETGLLLKARPDLSVPRLAMDTKTTTQSIASYPYAKTMHSAGQHIQAAMGLDVIYQATENHIQNWVLLVVEQHRYHDVALYPLGPRTLHLGFERYREAVRLLAECLEADRWPGVQEMERRRAGIDGLMPLEAPDYALRYLEY